MFATARYIRGTALAETAITLSFTLLCLLGGVQLGLLGVYQLELDGATFFFAHNVAVGVTNYNTLNHDLGPIFPNVPMSLTPQFASPPVTNESVNYTQWGTLNNRYGGASLIRPQRVEAGASLNVQNFSVLGTSIQMSSGMIDGRPMVGNHDDDAQGAGYDSATVFSTLVNPLSQDDQNVPPYYFTFAFQWYCNTFVNQTQPNCNGNRQLHSLGLAEFLKHDNYQAAQNGVVSGGDFYPMACHQRVYANLETAFPAVQPTMPPGPNGWSQSNYDENNGPTSVSAWGGAAFGQVYNWDVKSIHGEGGGILGTQYPLPYSWGCP